MIEFVTHGLHNVSLSSAHPLWVVDAAFLVIKKISIIYIYQSQHITIPSPLFLNVLELATETQNERHVSNTKLNQLIINRVTKAALYNGLN